MLDSTYFGFNPDTIASLGEEARTVALRRADSFSNYPFVWKQVGSELVLTPERLELAESVVATLSTCGYSKLELEGMDEVQAMAALAAAVNVHVPREIRQPPMSTSKLRALLLEIDAGNRNSCACTDAIQEALKNKWWFDMAKFPRLVGGGSWNKKDGTATEFKIHDHNYRAHKPEISRFDEAGVSISFDMDHIRTGQRDDHGYVDILLTPTPNDVKRANITYALAVYKAGGMSGDVEVKKENLEQVIPPTRGWEALVGIAVSAVVKSIAEGSDSGGLSNGQIIFPNAIAKAMVAACACFYFHT